MLRLDKLLFLCCGAQSFQLVLHSTLNPIVGIVVTTSPIYNITYGMSFIS